MKIKKKKASSSVKARLRQLVKIRGRVNLVSSPPSFASQLIEHLNGFQMGKYMHHGLQFVWTLRWRVVAGGGTKGATSVL
jgi:hypothetical protein